MCLGGGRAGPPPEKLVALWAHCESNIWGMWLCDQHPQTCTATVSRVQPPGTCPAETPTGASRTVDHIKVLRTQRLTRCFPGPPARPGPAPPSLHAPPLARLSPTHLRDHNAHPAPASFRTDPRLRGAGHRGPGLGRPAHGDTVGKQWSWDSARSGCGADHGPSCLPLLRYSGTLSCPFPERDGPAMESNEVRPGFC